MRPRIARLLRRTANRLDPPSTVGGWTQFVTVKASDGGVTMYVNGEPVATTANSGGDCTIESWVAPRPRLRAVTDEGETA